jgi:hypothetical protein
MISSLYICITLREKLHGRADLWTGISCLGADGPYERFRNSVVDMSKIPREELVNTMHRRNGDVQCVSFGADGNATFRYQTFGQLLHLLVDR